MKAAPKAPPRPAPDHYPVAVAAVLVVYATLALFPIVSDDIFLYLAIGRDFFRTGSFPATDPYLFSLPDHPWEIMHEWGSFLLAFAIYKVLGFNGLIIVKAAFVVAIGSIPFLLARRLGYRSPVVPFLALLAGFAAADRFIERTSLISDGLLPAVLAIVLAERRRPGRLRFLLPVIFLVWVNLHPGFLAGLAIVGASLLFDLPRWRDRNVRIFAACFGGSVLALLANPRGVRGVLYPLNALSPQWGVYKRYYFEWLPTMDPFYRSATGVIVFLVLLAVVVVLLAASIRARRRPWYEAAVLAFVTWQGFSAIRYVPLASFCLAMLGTELAAAGRVLAQETARAGPPAAPGSSRWRREAMISAITTSLVIVTVALAGKIALLGYSSYAEGRTVGLGVDEHVHPIRAAEFIDQVGLSVNIFNKHDFGAYLAWAWDHRRKLFYHGAANDPEFYERDYIGISNSPEDFDRVIKKYDIGAFLLRRPWVPFEQLPFLFRLLHSRPEWSLVFIDDTSVIFLRDVPANREIIARYKIKPFG